MNSVRNAIEWRVAKIRDTDYPTPESIRIYCVNGLCRPEAYQLFFRLDNNKIRYIQQLGWLVRSEYKRRSQNSTIFSFITNFSDKINSSFWKRMKQLLSL